MANTFAVFESEFHREDEITLVALVEESELIEKATEIIISSGRRMETTSIVLSQKNLKELISALQARVDGEINAFSGTFNQ